jgi:hypothetical protein
MLFYSFLMSISMQEFDLSPITDNWTLNVAKSVARDFSASNITVKKLNAGASNQFI